jgi:hypothetical protein
MVWAGTGKNLEKRIAKRVRQFRSRHYLPVLGFPHLESNRALVPPGGRPENAIGLETDGFHGVLKCVDGPKGSGGDQDHPAPCGDGQQTAVFRQRYGGGIRGESKRRAGSVIGGDQGAHALQRDGGDMALPGDRNPVCLWLRLTSRSAAIGIISGWSASCGSCSPSEDTGPT